MEVINAQPPPKIDDSTVIPVLVSPHAYSSLLRHTPGKQETWAQDHLPFTTTLIPATPGRHALHWHEL